MLSRLIASVLPFKSPLLFESIASNPDLYGPFWVAATLVFVIGAAANWNSWIKTPTENVRACISLMICQSISAFGSLQAHEWSYDFTLMSVSMSVVFGYLGCVPIAIWATMRYYSVPVPFLQLLCTFGYSLTVFVPTAVCADGVVSVCLALILVCAQILCIAPSNVFAWLAISYATMTASSLLAVSVYPVVKEHTATANPSVPIGLIAAPITTQIGFALIMKFFFFGQTS